MKRNNFVGYMGMVLLLSAGMAGCANTSNNNTMNTDVSGSNQEQEGVADAEEYFNSLLEQNGGDYQQAPPVTDDQQADNKDQTESTNEGSEQKATIEIDPLNRDNEYMQIVPMGETCSVDLNNDGRIDEITYNAVPSSTAEYGTKVETFTINDGDYKYTLFLSDQGIHIQNPDLDWYYITDINTRDAYKEIAILDHGANGIPYTYFIRFVGNGTYCLGYVPYFPDDSCFHIKGDGSVESAHDMNLLPGWQTSAVWLSGSDQMLSSNLDMRIPDVFYIDEEQADNSFTQLKDLKLHKIRNQNAATVSAKVSDSLVTFTQTDDKHWVYMKRDDGVEGWIYFENSDTIVSGGKKYNRRDVFKN